MRLLKLDEPRLFELAADWLGRKEHYQWLDFGNGVQQLTPVSLKIMMQRDIHELRVFTTEEEVAIGVVGLSNVNRTFKTASAWVVLGERRYSGRGYPARAASRILTLGFGEIGLRAVSAWTLETNKPAIRMLRRLNFHCIGRQRRCHYLEGRPLDRLLFDLLAEEHHEI